VSNRREVGLLGYRIRQRIRYVLLAVTQLRQEAVEYSNVVQFCKGQAVSDASPSQLRAADGGQVLAETAGAPRDLFLGEPLPDLLDGLAPRFRQSFCWVRVRYGLLPSLDEASAEIPGHRFLKADHTRSDAAGDASERDLAEHRTL
jgi:hypothetical protein